MFILLRVFVNDCINLVVQTVLTCHIQQSAQQIPIGPGCLKGEGRAEECLKMINLSAVVLEPSCHWGHLFDCLYCAAGHGMQTWNQLVLLVEVVRAVGIPAKIKIYAKKIALILKSY